MEEIIKLLIIEDDDSQIQLYKDIIDQFNKKSNQFRFDINIVKTFVEGETALKSPNYDAAIIDLKLSSSKELEGKKLVRSVYKKIRLPIIIYSGSLAQIDDIHENALLKKRLRTVQFTSILEEVISIFRTGITTLLRPDGMLDNKLTNIFWTHLSQDLDTWIEHNNPNTLLRYILSHFQESLDINMDGDFEEYHPNEVYIRPPIKKNLHTGDLIKHEENFYLVLTPACDIVIQKYEQLENGDKKPIRKAENIILVKVDEFDLNNYCEGKTGKALKDKIRNYVNNSNYRYHYLPPSINVNGFLIDFQDITTLKFGINHERVATISSPFIKDIISRFSNYYSRQGQPTFEQDIIVNSLFDSAKVVV